MGLRLAALALAGWAGLVQAVGLGEIEVKSRLNQPLNAVIPITSGTPKELDTLGVELATNEEFERAGMDRAEFLSSLRFKVDNGAIRVSSRDLAREPFVSFLLSVRWNGGRLLREYTVLLDPPANAAARAEPPATTAAAEPEPTAEAAPAPPAAAPSVTRPPAATRSAPPPEPAPAASAASAPPAGGAGTYGPVAPQETLWSIAYRLRPDPSLTMDQMQVALLRANPQAFHEGQLTGLMKGSTLRVPTRAQVAAVDAQEARSLVIAANHGAPPGAAARPSGKRKARAAAPAAASPESGAAPATTSETPSSAPAPAPTPESSAPPPAETSPSMPAASPVSGTPPPASAAAPATATATPAAPVTAPATSAAPAAATASPGDSAPQTTPAPAGNETTAPASVATPESARPEAPRTTAMPPPAPVRSPPPPDEGGLVQELVARARDIGSNPLLLPIAGALLLIALAAIAVQKVRNKLAERAYKRAAGGKRVPTSGMFARAGAADVSVDVSTPEPEPPAPSALTELEAAAEDDSPTIQAPARADRFAATQVQMASTLQSTVQQATQAIAAAPVAAPAKLDFDVTGKFAEETVQINLDAGDPVSEAEFHRAYGLYDEAALLLKQALQKEPGRSDARVKLAEIYFEASRAPEFVETARQLKGTLPAAEWQKIAFMGSQIAPNDELFKGAAAAGAGAVDLAFDEPAAPSPAPAAPAAAVPAGDMLDFKLDEVQLPDAPAPAADTPAPAAEGALEFDLGSLSLDEPKAAAPASAAEPAPAAASDAIDLGEFDLKLDESPASAGPAATESATAGVADADALQFDLSSEPAAAEPVLEVSAADVAIDDVPVASGDEASTKLDLARAYMDMGDNDMAKSLLGEVLKQGTSQQKKEAQDLLQRVPA
ncbi:MAG TPA: FimV/HubP family polar landmark protein [Candidatus Binatia bacterium]|nr:FimV/HubP family polar landmark protein [Candidatus Binatia bacterium]